MELKVIPPIQLLISALLMQICVTLLPSLNYNFSYSLILNGVIPCLLVLLAFTLGISALYIFKKHQTTYHPHCPEKSRTVVSSGIYRYSRNPMYLAMILLLVALALYLQNIACFAVIPLFIGYMTIFQIMPEERILNQNFGQSYQCYKKQVRRWL